jgi:hypothetical protein
MDGTTLGNQADINAANTARTTATKVLAVQAVDASGSVVSSGSTKIEDGTTASNKAVIDRADTARTAATNVLVVQAIDAAGNVGSSGEDVRVDDAAFTPATDKGSIIMGIVTSDLVDDGDAGAVAMTLGRSLKVQDDAHDVGTTSNKISEVSPLNDEISNAFIEVDTTNVAAATHYYPTSAGITMDGYKDLSLSGKLIDADETLTLWVEAMNDEDTASGDWVKVYGNDLEGNAAVNQVTVTNDTLTFALSYANLNFRYIRCALTAGGATNTVIIKGRAKAL